jgi:hypothetical protein
LNNACPTCGAIYNVFPKDVGRRIKCKKCGSSLEVRDSGLEIEDPNAPPPVTGKPVEESEVDESPKRKKDRRTSGPAFNPAELLKQLGGIPTILFALGLFLVIFTGFQEAIGKAKLDKRQAAIDEIQAEVNGAQRKYEEKKEHTDQETKDLQQLRESYDKKKKLAEEDRTISELANKRSSYMDKYVLMLGFLLIAFGCLGYLISDFGMVLRVVAAIILLFMVMALFKASVGQSAGVGAGINLG